LFSKDGGPKFLGDLAFEPQLYFTDLYSLGARTCAAKEPIPTALEMSCRFPLAFSGFSSDSDMVDGGLAMNLPVDELKKDESTMGTVIGVGFKSSFEAPQRGNLLSYTQQLFSAAIQSGVARSEMILGPENVYPIETHIGTFEFEKAIDEGLGDHYDLTARRFEDWLNIWLQKRVGRPTDTMNRTRRFIRPTPTNAPWPIVIIRDLEDRLKSEPCIYIESIAMLDTALFDDKAIFSGNYRSRTVQRFCIVRKTNVLQFSFQIGKNGSFSSTNLGCTVSDCNLRSLQFVPHVQELTESDDQVRSFRVFFLFDEPLMADSPGQPYVLEFEHEGDDPFPALGQDAEATTMTAFQGNADEVTVAVAFPRERTGEHARHVDVASLPKEKLVAMGYKLDKYNAFVPSTELKAPEFQHLMNLEMPNAYYFLAGRRATKVKQGETVGLAIE
jgi:hypothetical protein